MKKAAALFLALTICATLAACGKPSNITSADPASKSEANSAQSVGSGSGGSSSGAGDTDVSASSGSTEQNEDEWWVYWLADVDSGRYILYMGHVDDQNSFDISYCEYGDENVYTFGGTFAKKDDGNYVLLSNYGDVFNLCVRDKEATLTGDTLYGELSFELPDNPSNPFKGIDQIEWLKGEIDIS